MFFSGHGGAQTSAPGEWTHPKPEQPTYSTPSKLSPDVVLPHSVRTAPRQPKEDDATAAFPETVAALCNSSDGSSIGSNISTVSCHRDSSINSTPNSLLSSGADAVQDKQVARNSNMVATELLVAAHPAAATKRPNKLSQLVRRVFPTPGSTAISRNGKGHQQLLLPCLLGDPFVCLSVDRRVGVSAGTLLGRLSIFYFLFPPALEQPQEREMKGQVLVPQAYSDDGVAICWMDPSYVTAIMGASDLVQWKLPSLRLMGSEQLSLFAGRSAFNSVTISMRLLRRQKDTQQLLLLYRYCSKALAAMILFKIKHPESDASGLPLISSNEERQEQRKAWADALASGVCTLDPQQQQQQDPLLRNHSTCLLGTGAACIMDLREGEMYERYETSYFCKLWRSVEACNLIALDFNGDFVLCCTGDGSVDRRWLYVVDARGASRQVEESQGWCAARRNYMDEYLVYKRLAPRCMERACFLSSFFLLVSASNSIAVYDMRVSFFTYYSSRAKALDIMKTADGAASAAFACCGGSCTNYKGAEQPMHGISASSSGSRLLRRQGASIASADMGTRQERDNHVRHSNKDEDANPPLQCLPALFLRCLQKSIAEHEKMNAATKGRISTSFSRIVGGVSSARPEPCQPDVDTQVAPAIRRETAERRRMSSGFQTGEKEMMQVLCEGEGELGENVWDTKEHMYHRDISEAYEGKFYAFFLFENTPLAFRVCDAFFRFCSLLLQYQRQQQQRGSLCSEDTPAGGPQRPSPLCSKKPMMSYRQKGRVLCVDSSRIDFCFLTVDSSGWLRAFSLFRSKPLQCVRLDKGLFSAGWPYTVASDGPVVAYTTDKGVYGLLLNEANLGCSWVTGAEAFCSLPLISDIHRTKTASSRKP